MPARDGSMHRLPPYVVDLCRKMRREPTEPEAWLWACLRGRRLSRAKFRRQRPLGRYIADFCCDEAKLVIELDGGVHARQGEYDAVRDEYLTAVGYRVLRIANEDVAADPEAVLARILEEITQGDGRIVAPGSSSPARQRAAGSGGLVTPDSSSPREGEEAG